MVNSEEFTKRLQKILEYYELSAASFADAIDVGRSSISHILSGRNKPSLDFVLKIIQTFPEVELYWLLNGKGNFPPVPGEMNKKENKPPSAPLTTPEAKNFTSPPIAPNTTSPGSSTKDKTIKKIVFFYTDGSFEAFEN